VIQHQTLLTRRQQFGDQIRQRFTMDRISGHRGVHEYILQAVNAAFIVLFATAATAYRECRLNAKRQIPKS
jgi:hypothetical protein